MRIAIMQPYFFPYIGYWQLINAVDQFIIYDDVQYIKGGWINRNKIRIQNEAKYFTLQLYGSGSNVNINEITIGSNTQTLLKTVEYNYKKRPFFTQVFPLISEILINPEKKLGEFLKYQIESITAYLGITTKVSLSSNFQFENKGELRGVDRVIDICKRFQAVTYINSIGGSELYSKNLFNDNSIDLRFLHSEDIVYDQGVIPFIPNLSIIDVIMNNDIRQIKLFLERYKLV